MGTETEIRRTFGVALSADERERLQRLAEAEHRTPSWLVRYLIDRYARERGDQ